MATTDINGLVYYETTDPVTPLQNVLNAMTTSVTNALDATDRVFFVADETARDNLLAARGAPLTVAREDTGNWERNAGSEWGPVGTVGFLAGLDSTTEVISSGAPVTASTGSVTVPGLAGRRVRVTVYARMNAAAAGALGRTTVTVDGSSVADVQATLAAVGSGGEFRLTGVRTVALAPGAHATAVTVSRPAGSGNVGLAEHHVTFEDVGPA